MIHLSFLESIAASRAKVSHMRPRARTDRLFSHLPVLETDRLILRPVCPEDADDFFAFASDPLVTRYITWTTHRSREETSQFIVRQFLDRYR